MRQNFIKHQFYIIFNEIDFESLSNFIKYKSINTSFSEIFKTQHMIDFLCHKQFSNVNNEVVTIFNKFFNSARFYRCDLNFSIWVNLVTNNSNYRKKFIAVIDRAVIMKINDDHFYASRFADSMNYTFRFISNLTFRNLYCHVVLYNLKFIYSIVQTLEQVHDELFIDVREHSISEKKKNNSIDVVFKSADEVKRIRLYIIYTILFVKFIITTHITKH